MTIDLRRLERHNRRMRVDLRLLRASNSESSSAFEARIVSLEAQVAGFDARITALEAAGTDLKPWMAYDATGNTVITGTPAQLILDTVAVADAGYTLAANQVTINNAGTYLISWASSYNITDTAGGTRGSVDGWVELNSGAGFNPIIGSYCRVYHREASGGSGISCAFIEAFASGDILRVMLDRIYSTTNIDTVANQSSLSILKVA